jgi:alkyl hydroperoxide reductase subunit AhpF
MAIVSDQIKEQLRARFEKLAGPIQLRLFTRPGSSRLILPGGVGCSTCEDARQIAEAARDAAPEKISLEVIDISRDPEAASTAGITDVPTILVSSELVDGRIRFQGLPAGTEFAAFVDAIERVSRGEHGLSESSLDGLKKLTQAVEVMVFATPT